ncbi:unnamed protein product [Pedinophyceae sp. YPF-701]|nr:unnamed protein product [Pedinophyceae sp. YPF-701]
MVPKQAAEGKKFKGVTQRASGSYAAHVWCSGDIGPNREMHIASCPSMEIAACCYDIVCCYIARCLRPEPRKAPDTLNFTEAPYWHEGGILWDVLHGSEPAPKLQAFIKLLRPRVKHIPGPEALRGGAPLEADSSSKNPEVAAAADAAAAAAGATVSSSSSQANGHSAGNPSTNSYGNSDDNGVQAFQGLHVTSPSDVLPVPEGRRATEPRLLTRRADSMGRGAHTPRGARATTTHLDPSHSGRSAADAALRPRGGAAFKRGSGGASGRVRLSAGENLPQEAMAFATADPGARPQSHRGDRRHSMGLRLSAGNFNTLVNMHAHSAHGPGDLHGDVHPHVYGGISLESSPVAQPAYGALMPLPPSAPPAMDVDGALASEGPMGSWNKPQGAAFGGQQQRRDWSATGTLPSDSTRSWENQAGLWDQDAPMDACLDAPFPEAPPCEFEQYLDVLRRET